MVNVLVPHKNVKCRFSDYLLLESVWTGAVFHQPSVTVDSPDLWLYTRAGLPPSAGSGPAPAPGPGQPGAPGGGCGQGPPALLPLPGTPGRMTAGTQPFFSNSYFSPVNSLACDPAPLLRNAGRG